MLTRSDRQLASSSKKSSPPRVRIAERRWGIVLQFYFIFLLAVLKNHYIAHAANAIDRIWSNGSASAPADGAAWRSHGSSSKIPEAIPWRTGNRWDPRAVNVRSWLFFLALFFVNIV